MQTYPETSFTFKPLSKPINWDRVRCLDLERHMPRIVEKCDVTLLLAYLDDAAVGNCSLEDESGTRGINNLMQMSQYSIQYLLNCQSTLNRRGKIVKSALRNFESEEQALDLEITKYRAREKALRRECRDDDNLLDEYLCLLESIDPNLANSKRHEQKHARKHARNHERQLHNRHNLHEIHFENRSAHNSRPHAAVTGDHHRHHHQHRDPADSGTVSAGYRYVQQESDFRVSTESEFRDSINMLPTRQLQTIQTVDDNRARQWPAETATHAGSSEQSRSLQPQQSKEATLLAAASGPLPRMTSSRSPVTAGVTAGVIAVSAPKGVPRSSSGVHVLQPVQVLLPRSQPSSSSASPLLPVSQTQSVSVAGAGDASVEPATAASTSLLLMSTDSLTASPAPALDARLSSTTVMSVDSLTTSRSPEQPTAHTLNLLQDGVASVSLRAVSTLDEEEDLVREFEDISDYLGGESPAVKRPMVDIVRNNGRGTATSDSVSVLHHVHNEEQMQAAQDELEMEDFTEDYGDNDSSLAQFGAPAHAQHMHSSLTNKNNDNERVDPARDVDREKTSVLGGAIHVPAKRPSLTEIGQADSSFMTGEAPREALLNTVPATNVKSKKLSAASTWAPTSSSNISSNTNNTDSNRNSSNDAASKTSLVDLRSQGGGRPGLLSRHTQQVQEHDSIFERPSTFDRSFEDSFDESCGSDLVDVSKSVAVDPFVEIQRQNMEADAQRHKKHQNNYDTGGGAGAGAGGEEEESTAEPGHDHYSPPGHLRANSALSLFGGSSYGGSYSSSVRDGGINRSRGNDPYGDDDMVLLETRTKFSPMTMTGTIGLGSNTTEDENDQFSSSNKYSRSEDELESGSSAGASPRAQAQASSNGSKRLEWLTGRAATELTETAVALDISVNAISLDEGVTSEYQEVQIKLEFLNVESTLSPVVNMSASMRPVNYSAHMCFLNNHNISMLTDEIHSEQENLSVRVIVVGASDGFVIGIAEVMLWVMVEDSCSIIRNEVEIVCQESSDILGSVIVDVKGHHLLGRCNK